MHILLLTDRFIPEIAAPSFRGIEHARIWVSLGHQVTVVTCFPNFPHGKVFPGYKNRFFQEEWIDGIRVIRLWSYMAENSGFMRRIVDNASFMCSAVLQSSRYGAFDVILATSPPLFVPMAGYMISKLFRRPWVFELRDLWPASIRAVGAMNGRIPDLLERLELFLYRKSDRIISLTHAFKTDLINRGIQPDKIDIVENGVNEALFNPGNVTFDARKVMGINNEDFLAGYIGTTGMAHGLETILEAADLCREKDSIKFLIMGEGAERSRLGALAKSKELTNVIFKDFAPHEEIPSYLAALDLFVVHLKPDPVFRTVIPSKIFEAMAMGTPLLHAVDGESAEIVKKSGAGVCIPSGDVYKMAEAILELSKQLMKLEQMTQRGPVVIRKKYSRDLKAKAALRTMAEAIRLETNTSVYVPEAPGEKPIRPETACELNRNHDCS
jgi:glycosyltransferase involved in cell wall biosynthesis